MEGVQEAVISIGNKRSVSKRKADCTRPVYEYFCSKVIKRQLWMQKTCRLERNEASRLLWMCNISVQMCWEKSWAWKASRCSMQGWRPCWFEHVVRINEDCSIKKYWLLTKLKREFQNYRRWCSGSWPQAVGPHGGDDNGLRFLVILGSWRYSLSAMKLNYSNHI